MVNGDNYSGSEVLVIDHFDNGINLYQTREALSQREENIIINNPVDRVLYPKYKASRPIYSKNKLPSLVGNLILGPVTGLTNIARYDKGLFIFGGDDLNINTIQSSLRKTDVQSIKSSYNTEVDVLKVNLYFRTKEDSKKYFNDLSKSLKKDLGSNIITKSFINNDYIEKELNKQNNKDVKYSKGVVIDFKVVPKE